MLKKVTAKKGRIFFWNAIKHFSTNLWWINNDSITPEEKKVFKNEPKETTKVFDNSYTNIEETTFGNRTSSIGGSNFQYRDRATIKKIIGFYKNVPSVRSVSLWRFINDIILPIIQTLLSNFVSTYRKYYSANNVLIENWKKNLDNNKIVGACFMDLSKPFIAYLMIAL